MRQRFVHVATSDDYARKFPQTPHGYDGPGLYNKRSGYMMDRPQTDELFAPMVMRDTPDYQSPIDGRWITSRSWRREDLARNNCIEVDPPRKPKGFKNARFAVKRSLPLCEERASRIDKDDPVWRTPKSGPVKSHSKASEHDRMVRKS